MRYDIKCKNCGSGNIILQTVELWQKDVDIEFYEGGEYELKESECYLVDESYDSRRVKCKECGWEAYMPNIPYEIKQVFNDIFD